MRCTVKNLGPDGEIIRHQETQEVDKVMAGELELLDQAIEQFCDSRNQRPRKRRFCVSFDATVGGSMSDPKHVLCQDCFKLKPYTDTRHNSEEQCECGGDFCGCPGCQIAIEGLLAGETKAAILDTLCDIHCWTHEGIEYRIEVSPWSAMIFCLSRGQ